MDKKRIAGIAVLLASLAVFFLLTNLTYGSNKLNSLVASDGEFENLQMGRADVDFEELSLKFNGNACFKEAESDNFFYSMIGNSEASYNPTIKAFSRQKGLKVAFNKALSKESIQESAPLEMLVYNDKYFHKYQLYTTTLPIMNIDCNKEISEEDCKMKMSLWDNTEGSSARFIASDGLVRFRGASTLHYPKKGLKLSLTERSLGDNKRCNNVSLLGMRQDDDWILYAAYNDQEKVRNVFSHNLWERSLAKDNSLGVDAGMEYKYLELFVNGKYEGLYALGSPLDELQFKLSGDCSREALYKSVYWASLNGILMPEGGVTGFEAKSPSLSERLNSTVYRDGTYIDQSNWDLFLDYAYNLERNRNDSGELLEGIDIDNAIDIYLFFALIQGMDTTMGYQAKNYYFSVKKDPKTGNLKALYAPWDMDISWGNYWVGDIAYNFTLPYRVGVEENFIFEQGYLNQIIVNNDSDIVEKLVEKYKELRKGPWSEESIVNMLKEYEEDIYSSGAFIRDMKRWPEGNYNDPSEGLSQFKKYVRRRLNETDGYISRLDKKKDQSVFVRRSAQYKDFENKNFFIAINNPKVLSDKEYLELFSYMGIDSKYLKSDAKYLLFNGYDGNLEVLTKERDEGFEYDSTIGHISFKRIEGGSYFSDEDFSVFVDDKFCYDTIKAYEPDIRFYFIDEDKAQTMDLTKDYKLDLIISTFSDLKLYLKAADVLGYELKIEYADAGFLQDLALKELIDKMGDRVSMSENKNAANGLYITTKDPVLDRLMDTVYYVYVLEVLDSKVECRVTNCIRDN